ncbi:hypothetical protein [Ornithinimicrobium faecis]|uniref:META domain-containing protein n=1 Tax=Ornithinimicrobium faecis TaxID=2934158 RepID=A0ABY4YSX2_9MICO|nr:MULTISPECIES: hypothetical protein [unclassified Ornithinimicrobium]USQ79684.1 hypothetical protein NF556_19175 [Ornithinimicrobium sp. HY1793]
MSDEEIRDLLDLGAADYEFGPPIEADETWAAGRRSHTRRSWGVGLGAVAAAAAVVGVVWTQGLGGGEDTPPPPQPADGTLTGPVPTLTDTGAEPRGEPFFAQFEKAGNEAPAQLSGASEPATLADLQGTWIGPEGEEFTFDGEQLNAVSSACHSNAGTVELTPEGRLRPVSSWDATVANGNCPQEAAMPPWGPALHQGPFVSLDDETLMISGLDGTTAEPRVQVALTLGQVDETGFNWADVPSATGVTPITLGHDFALSLSGDDDETLGSINLVRLEEIPGIAAAAQDPEIEVIGSPGTCPQVMESSLRTDDVLLAGPPRPMPACADGSAAFLPPSEPPPAAVALLRSGPTISLDDDTLVISGTIPESLVDQATPPSDATAPTSEPPNEEGAEDPPVSGDLPESSGPSVLVVMSEGAWEPTGELTPLTDRQAVDQRWLPVTTDSEPPEVGLDPSGDRGLSFDGTTWRIRDCGIDISMDGAIENGRLLTRGEPVVVPDPDPGAACTFPLTADDWVGILTGEPMLSTDSEILVIEGTVEDSFQVPVGMALLPAGVTDPTVGPVTTVTPEDLAAGLTEAPADDIGVSDVRDPQPEHATTLSMQDHVVTVDVGCDEPLRGPAWFTHVGPEEFNWQLVAALGNDPDCAGPAAADAQLWRQMLAEGVFLHHSGDYVILDSMAEPPADR